MYLSIYGMSFLKTLFYLAVFSGLWYGGKQLVKRYVPHIPVWRWLAGLGLALWAYFVLKYTLFSRSSLAQDTIWIPFHQLWQLLHGGNPEILRMLWMNTLLFIPMGIFLPELLPEKWSRRGKLLLVIASGLIFSTCIEASQWLWQLGQAEVDDVIANTLGTLLGCGIFVLGNRIISRKKS